MQLTLLGQQASIEFGWRAQKQVRVHRLGESSAETLTASAVTTSTTPVVGPEQAGRARACACWRCDGGCALDFRLSSYSSEVQQPHRSEEATRNLDRPYDLRKVLEDLAADSPQRRDSEHRFPVRPDAAVVLVQSRLPTYKINASSHPQIDDRR